MEDRITAALRGKPMAPPVPAPVPQADGDGGEELKGDGSAQSGYAEPQLGPFECHNCVHFQDPGRCNHPQVESDPEVEGMVDPEGCCNFFKSSGRESQEQEHTEGLGEENESEYEHQE